MKLVKSGMLLLFLTICFAPLIWAGNRNWKIIVDETPYHPCTMAGFETKDYGITVGYAGEVHYTKDGGKTWPRASSFSMCRFGLEIVNDKVAWHCGNQGNVRYTLDGGMIWNSATNFGSNEPDHCRFLSFIDEKTGWIGSPYDLASTHDGGRTWNVITLPKECADISAIDLRSPRDGYIFDSRGFLFITNDGAKTWTKQSIGLDKGQTLMLLYTPSAAMRFINAEQGIIAYYQKGKGVMAKLTEDGGRTWKEESVIKNMGGLYLSKNGQLLTVTSRASGNNRNAKITVLSHYKL